MTSRRSNSRDSNRVRTQTGSANAERIQSGDVSDALTEVLREETQLPWPSTQGAKDPEGEKSVTRVKSSSATGSEGRDRPPKKDKTNGSDHRLGDSGKAAVAKQFHWQFSHSKDCPITEDPDSVAHLVKHFKPAGCPLPSLRNMTEHEAYVKMAVAHAKAIEADNEFAVTLEKRLQDVPRSDELYEIKKVVRELKLGLKMAQDRECANAAQLAAAEKLGNQAASLEARLRVFSDDLRRATYEAKTTMADSYLDVLVSLKEKWEKKKAVTDCEARLQEVVANIELLKEIMSNNLLASDELLRLRAKEIELGSEIDVMATSDFSVGKPDLPQISEDLPEDFFDKVPSAADDVAKCSGDRTGTARPRFTLGFKVCAVTSRLSIFLLRILLESYRFKVREARFRPCVGRLKIKRVIKLRLFKTADVFVGANRQTECKIGFLEEISPREDFCPSSEAIGLEDEIFHAGYFRELSS
ncbi:hypothetical protein F2Q69_00013780 [Brassica cretica]|uniref:Uncharacterized protein n=1 Tax=Brassica cretica TaxID=69181 RepID=A0A8S9R6E0_BRACR|nr:hypothetical protein F2Q69_00013780 [Brassica cretica]